MKFYQIGSNGNAPYGALFETMAEAKREVGFRQREGRDYADDAMRIGGVHVPLCTYQIHEVER